MQRNGPIMRIAILGLTISALAPTAWGGDPGDPSRLVKMGGDRDKIKSGGAPIKPGSPAETKVVPHVAKPAPTKAAPIRHTHRRRHPHHRRYEVRRPAVRPSAPRIRGIDVSPRSPFNPPRVALA